MRHACEPKSHFDSAQCAYKHQVVETSQMADPESLALQLRERVGLAVARLQGEIRCRVADLQLVGRCAERQCDDGSQQGIEGDTQRRRARMDLITVASACRA